MEALFPFDSPTTVYSLDFTQHLVLVPVPSHTRLAVSLFPACATAPCNQRRGKQRVGIFPRSEGENALNRRAQYGLRSAAESDTEASVSVIRDHCPQQGPGTGHWRTCRGQDSLLHSSGRGFPNVACDLTKWQYPLLLFL